MRPSVTANPPPPQWPLRLLRRLLNPHYLEELEGDLEERYDDNVMKYGPRKAQRLFVYGAFKLLRPNLMKNLSGDFRLNHYGMFRNYLKTSLRSIRRNALFSAINVIGLAISMSVGILMILFLSEIYSFDDFHEHEEDIYRITTTSQFMGNEDNWATASIFVADQVKEQASQVEDMVILRQGLLADVKTNTDFVNISGFYSTSSFFSVFSFDLLEGSAETALDEPGSIVLTASIAKKLFGEEEALGQTLELESTGGWQNRVISGVVTGVLEDLPINSHIQFEALVSLSTYDQPATGPGWREDFKTNPGDFHSAHVYLRLNEGTSTDGVELIMADILTDFNAGMEHPISHSLQPLSTCATDDQSLNPPGPSFSQRKIYIMMGLTLIVLLSACFNYTTLSLARSLRRTKEVGVRKVTGATGGQIFSQFALEAVVLSVFALILGSGLFYIIKPQFLALPNPTARGHNMFLLEIGAEHLVVLLAFAIIVGCVAGFAPALFLSKLQTLNAFHPQGRSTARPRIDLRRGLTVIQFVLSIGLIMCSALIYDQYEYAMNYELGYNTDNIINVHIKGDYADILENEYAAIPEVVETARSARVIGYSTVFGMVETEDKSKSVRFLFNEVDHNYLDMHNFELLAGSNFQPLADDASYDHIIINEAMLKELEMANPDEAIGKHLWYKGDELKIIGVVEDFMTTSLVWDLDNKFGFIQRPLQDHGILGVKISNKDQIRTLIKLEDKFKEIDPLHPFDADFYNDQIATSYRSYKSMLTIITFLAYLAIAISTLGLLGMAVFTVETRMKEISIRRILGAGVKSLATLLSRSFVVMIGVASLIAIPVTIYLVDRWLLADFLYRSDFKVIDVLSGLLIVFAVGVLTIGWQVRTASMKNPSDTLRDE